VSSPRTEPRDAPGSFVVEGSRRFEEWTRLASQLPPLDAVVEVDARVLTRRLGSLPDEVNAILRLADGRRTLRRVIEESGRADVEAATLLVGLHADGVLRVAPATAPSPAAGTPAPDGVEWFANPEEARRAAQAAATMVPPAERARGPEPVRHSQAPAWVVGAVLALAAAILLGPEWARRQRAARPEPAASPVAVEPVPPALAPPALAITAPAPSAVTLPPAEPRPPEEARAPVAPPAAVRTPAYAGAMSQGEASYRSGDFPAAVASFRRAVAARETSEAQAALGRALSDAGRPEEALAALRRATVLDGSNGAAWLALGEVQLTRGDPASARAAYERYLAVDPSGRHAGEVRAVLERLRP
jgi:hypothetical protein